MTQLSTLADLDLCVAFAAALAAGDEALYDATWAIFVSRQRDERGQRDPIVTWNAFPPIPDRGFDWGAHRDSDEGGEARMGWGRTEAEAILDLVAIEQEDAEDRADVQAQLDAEREACEAEWRAEYERDEAADAKRDAMRDDPDMYRFDE